MTLPSPFGLEQSHEKKDPQIKQIDFLNINTRM